MNKLMLASLTLLVAGTAALPVKAGDDRRDDLKDWQEERREQLEERRELEKEHWEERRELEEERREALRELEKERREARRDWREDRDDDDHDEYEDRYDRHAVIRHDPGRYYRAKDRRWNGNHWQPQYRYRAPVRYAYPRGYRDQQWRVGHRLPSSYYQRNYHVDYRTYRLPSPPYGYHWVRVDRDVVLVANNSGLIRDILHGLFY